MTTLEAMQYFNTQPTVKHVSKHSEVGVFSLTKSSELQIAQTSREKLVIDSNPIIRNSLRIILSKNFVPGVDQLKVEKLMERLFISRTLTDTKLAKYLLETALRNTKLDSGNRFELNKAYVLTLQILRLFELKSTNYNRLKNHREILNQIVPMTAPNIA